MAVGGDLCPLAVDVAVALDFAAIGLDTQFVVTGFGELGGNMVAAFGQVIVHFLLVLYAFPMDQYACFS